MPLNRSRLAWGWPLAPPDFSAVRVGVGALLPAVRLDADTVAAIEARRERQLLERQLAGDAYVDQDLIFCDEPGSTIYPQRLTEKFGALRAAAKIRPGPTT